MKIFKLFLIILFYGCQKNLDYKIDIKNEALFYTNKIKKDNFIIIASYLSPIYKEFKNEEKFILEIFPKKFAIKNIRLNGKEVDFKEIKKDEILVQRSPLILPWARYFEISSKPVKDERLKLNFEISELGIFDLDFLKAVKSLYQNH